MDVAEKLFHLKDDCDTAPTFGVNAKLLILQAVELAAIEETSAPGPPVPTHAPVVTQKAAVERPTRLWIGSELTPLVPVRKRPLIEYDPRSSIPRLTRQGTADRLFGEYLVHLLECLHATKDNGLQVLMKDEALWLVAHKAAVSNEKDLYYKASSKASYVTAAGSASAQPSKYLPKENLSELKAKYLPGQEVSDTEEEVTLPTERGEPAATPPPACPNMFASDTDDDNDGDMERPSCSPASLKREIRASSLMSNPIAAALLSPKLPSLNGLTPGHSPSHDLPMDNYIVSPRHDDLEASSPAENGVGLDDGKQFGAERGSPSDTFLEPDDTVWDEDDVVMEEGSEDKKTEAGGSDREAEAGGTDGQTEAGGTDGQTEAGGTDGNTEAGGTGDTAAAGSSDREAEACSTRGKAEAGGTGRTPEAGGTDEKADAGVDGRKIKAGDMESNASLRSEAGGRRRERGFGNRGPSARITGRAVGKDERVVSALPVVDLDGRDKQAHSLDVAAGQGSPPRLRSDASTSKGVKHMRQKECDTDDQEPPTKRSRDRLDDSNRNREQRRLGRDDGEGERYRKEQRNGPTGGGQQWDKDERRGREDRGERDDRREEKRQRDDKRDRDWYKDKHRGQLDGQSRNQEQLDQHRNGPHPPKRRRPSHSPSPEPRTPRAHSRFAQAPKPSSADKDRAEPHTHPAPISDQHAPADTTHTRMKSEHEGIDGRSPSSEPGSARKDRGGFKGTRSKDREHSHVARQLSRSRPEYDSPRTDHETDHDRKTSKSRLGHVPLEQNPDIPAAHEPARTKSARSADCVPGSPIHHSHAPASPAAYRSPPQSGIHSTHEDPHSMVSVRQRKAAKSPLHASHEAGSPRVGRGAPTQKKRSRWAPIPTHEIQDPDHGIDLQNPDLDADGHDPDHGADLNDAGHGTDRRKSNHGTDRHNSDHRTNRHACKQSPTSPNQLHSPSDDVTIPGLSGKVRDASNPKAHSDSPRHQPPRDSARLGGMLPPTTSRNNTESKRRQFHAPLYVDAPRASPKRMEISPRETDTSPRHKGVSPHRQGQGRETDVSPKHRDSSPRRQGQDGRPNRSDPLGNRAGSRSHKSISPPRKSDSHHHKQTARTHRSSSPPHVPDSQQPKSDAQQPISDAKPHKSDTPQVKSDPQQRRWGPQRHKPDPEQQPKSEPHQHKSEPHQHKSEPHQHKSEPHQHKSEPHQHKSEPHQHKSESQHHKSEIHQHKSEAQRHRSDPKQARSEPEPPRDPSVHRAESRLGKAEHRDNQSNPGSEEPKEELGTRAGEPTSNGLHQEGEGRRGSCNSSSKDSPKEQKDKEGKERKAVAQGKSERRHRHDSRTDKVREDGRGEDRGKRSEHKRNERKDARRQEKGGEKHEKGDKRRSTSAGREAQKEGKEGLESSGRVSPEGTASVQPSGASRHKDDPEHLRRLVRDHLKQLVRNTLDPLYRSKDITREEYSLVAKKCVDKVMSAHPHEDTTAFVIREEKQIKKLVKSMVKHVLQKRPAESR